MTVRAYGVFMARNPLTPTLRESNPAAWAIWGTTLCLFLQDTVGLNMEELESQRLHWIPDRTVQLMKQIGTDFLVGEGAGSGLALEKALGAIAEIDWRLVDPSGSTVPRKNVYQFPLFAFGDCVSWKSAGPVGEGTLGVIPELRRRRGQSSGRGSV